MKLNEKEKGIHHNPDWPALGVSQEMQGDGQPARARKRQIIDKTAFPPSRILRKQLFK
jgi:hypothetical protein